MPRFRTQEWNGYKFRLLSHESVRYMLRDFLADFLPYWYGPIVFDLLILAPETASDSRLEYEWKLSKSKQDNKHDDDKVEGRGIVSFVGTERLPIIKEYAKAGHTYHRAYSPRHFKAFSHIQAVDLDISYPDVCKLTMRFRDETGKCSDFMLMSNLTVRDYDNDRWNFLVGAVVAIVGGIVGGILGYLLAR